MVIDILHIQIQSNKIILTPDIIFDFCVPVCAEHYSEESKIELTVTQTFFIQLTTSKNVGPNDLDTLT